MPDEMPDEMPATIGERIAAIALAREAAHARHQAALRELRVEELAIQASCPHSSRVEYPIGFDGVRWECRDCGAEVECGEALPF